jgi:hypothetical protein
MTTTVEGCPCGTAHEVDARSWAGFRLMTEHADPRITVTSPEGSWLVPRLFIACHGIRAAELAGLAERYGFERAAR